MLGPMMTINSPAKIMVRLAITPSVSWRCPAREVPKPWAALPSATPLAVWKRMRVNAKNKSPNIMPTKPVMMVNSDTSDAEPWISLANTTANGVEIERAIRLLVTSLSKWNILPIKNALATPTNMPTKIAIDRMGSWRRMTSRFS